MIDTEGFRSNIGIILCNKRQQLLWAKRVGQNAWQFPQGGVKLNESPEQTLYRELLEEVGLYKEQVNIIGCTQRWLRYRLPEHLIRHHRRPLCIGQKQLWYMLRLLCDDSNVCLDNSDKPEFDGWRWVNYWHPLREVVFFKRKVYRKALQELEPLLIK
jgi:putative (di)nucleoside polyphosphate hydrolase